MTNFSLTPTMLAAKRDAEQKRSADIRRLPLDGPLICRVANAMRDKRAELIAEPLSRCWERLAMAALEEAAKQEHL